MKLLLLGPPGVGKGTYGKLLAKELDFHLFSIGDLIRNEISLSTSIGKKMKNFNDSGTLIPDHIVIEFVKKKLDTFPNKVILDGFPRTISQAKELEVDRVLNLQMREKYLVQKLLGRRICKNISCGKNFNVANVIDSANAVEMPPLLPKTGSVNVCECGSALVKRKDDTESTIRSRLKVYGAETSPLVSYYSEKGCLSSVEIKKGLKDFPKILEIVEHSIKKSRL